ncbi:hypothetical protein EDD22DRAFT_960426 [Suillus occidentalis]|nr:hypothetical protein EDD22DRAFT_960426 [Suillus occidentalis]
MGWTASASRNFASYASDIIAQSPPHHSLHYATPTRHMRQLHASRLIHAPQAPLARTFPRLTRHSCDILTASVTYCHHQFTPSHHPEELPSVEYQVHALSPNRRNVPALRAPMSPYSRAIDTSLSHHCSHSHNHASFRQSPPSYPRAFVVFARTRVASRNPLSYRAFMPLWRLTPALSRAFRLLRAPQLRQSRFITVASATLTLRLFITAHSPITTSLVHHLMH